MRLRAGNLNPEKNPPSIVLPVKWRFHQARGNALLYILIAIALLGALTYSVSQQSNDSTDFVDNASNDEQIARMMTYAGTLASTLNQMVSAGNAKAETLYTDLKVDAPGSAAYGTAPFNFQIYHPMGGGMNYVTESGDTADSNTVAMGYFIVPGAIVKDIGPTDVTVGDILFVANIASTAACARINYLLTGSGTIPTLDSAAFTPLFSTHTATTITAANCASCVGKSQICVQSNAPTGGYGYYATLFPG